MCDFIIFFYFNFCLQQLEADLTGRAFPSDFEIRVLAKLEKRMRGNGGVLNKFANTRTSLLLSI